MKLYYTSRGELAFLASSLSPSIPDTALLCSVAERLNGGKEDPDLAKVSVLCGTDIKSLVKKCDPAYFLYLRDLSVSMLADYKKRAEGLSLGGYQNEERVCIRFPEDASAIQLLAAGLCARASGVSDIIFSMERGCFGHEHAAACRLTGVDTVWLCDSLDCAVRAAFGSRLTKPCDALVGCDGEAFDVALSLLTSVLHTESLPYGKKDGAVFLAFADADVSVAAADILRLSHHCPNRTYIAITEKEQTALALQDICSELELSAVVCSSFSECCAVLGKLPSLRTFIYGSVNAADVRADAMSTDALPPLRLATTLPSVFYPYTPLLFSKRSPDASLSAVSGITEFASSLAQHVSRGCLSDEDMTCIAVRLERESSHEDGTDREALTENGESANSGDLNEM